eukprot:GFKZ01004123.1.p1 GENE.GFKZ01004123.1~~GFKZ01004123.1.p1  ORF type:complete len:988 (+),score=137.04 GFKZ01004123.1:102-3065(+)
MPRDRPLYIPYRALGLVCNGPAAPVLHQQGTATFLTTPISEGRALHVFDIQLQLKLVSKPFPSEWPTSPITNLAAAHDLTFCALHTSIGVLKRLKPIALWSLHEDPIAHLLVIGDVLVSVCIARVAVWRIPASTKSDVGVGGELLAEIALPPGFEVSAITHPQTYMNKILVGAADGRCLLMNMRTKKFIHEFSSFGSKITSLAPSPVLDVIAIGLEDGRILLHNLRADETIVAFRHAADDERLERQAVRQITFRTDGDETMVTADAEGNFFAWDLNERLVLSEVRRVHIGGASLAQFLPGEPILVTAGFDNSIKVHIFDKDRGEARILRAREGHCLPPTVVRFCGYDGCMMVSAGLDKELRLVSIVKEARNRSFAQSIVNRNSSHARKRKRAALGLEKGDRRPELFARLPPITAIASNNIRQRDEDFANIVTVHDNSDALYTWRMQDGASHGHVLAPPEGPSKYQLAFRRGQNSVPKGKKKKEKPEGEQRNATCAALSPCGNYAVAGSQDGRVHCYNLQSGRHQGVYHDPNLKFNIDEQEKEDSRTTRPLWKKAHNNAVVSLAVDATGDYLITAGKSDGQVKFWNLYARDMLGTPIKAAGNISRIEWCKSSDLLAVACLDFCIYIYDGASRRLARHFAAHIAPILDFCFDPNGRRIVSASMDGTIRTWDLPSGRIIDTLHCEDTPTSVAVAPSGEYIASTHVNSLGISLWVDTSKFTSLVMLRQQLKEEDEATTVDPAEEEENLENEQLDVDKPDSSGNSESQKVEISYGNKLKHPITTPLSDQLATLSSKPSAHWTTLKNLQAIKERNKPIEPPRKPESAPFFLPTIKGLKFQFDVDAKDESKIKSHKKKRKGANLVGDQQSDDSWTNSKFGRLVAEEQYASAAELLRTQDASGVDFEIRTLDGAKSRTNAAIFFKEQLLSPQDFEITQAHLDVFLQAHGLELAKDKAGAQLLEDLQSAQHEAWDRLRGTFASVTSLSSYFTTDVQ